MTVPPHALPRPPQSRPPMSDTPATDLTLVTWNVNSIRSRMAHLQRFCVEWRPDIICLQETKVTDEQFPHEPIAALGYHLAIHGQNTYNGVAILSPHPITDVTLGFDGTGSEEQKRLIAATVAGVRVINAYVPNGSEVGSEKFAQKLRFLADLRVYLDQRHTPAEHLSIVGDFNVAPAPEDVYDPVALEGTVCYHPEERAALEKLRGWGFSDLYRRFETGAGHYSWWDYRGGSFPRDAGLRIDHIWASPPLEARSSACFIEKGERAREKASDHAPVIAAFAAQARTEGRGRMDQVLLNL